MALADLVRRLGGALVTAALTKSPAQLTPSHFTALGKLIGALPVGDLIALLEGRATVGTVMDLAEEAAAIVAVAFPPAAIPAREIQLGLEALEFLFGAARLAKPVRITPGQNPLRGGFEGARGHV